jgi:hypothetical protein
MAELIQQALDANEIAAIVTAFQRAHPHVAFFPGRQITGIALAWIGSTTAFSAVVRKP